jgi:hypothetical protein
MYGLHIDCLEKFMVENYGTAIWSEILALVLSEDEEQAMKKGGDESANRRDGGNDREFHQQTPGSWVVNKKYPDNLFLKLLAMSATKSEMKVDELIENLGCHFIEYIR